MENLKQVMQQTRLSTCMPIGPDVLDRSPVPASKCWASDTGTQQILISPGNINLMTYLNKLTT